VKQSSGFRVGPACEDCAFRSLGNTNLILPWVIGTEMPGGDLVGKSAEQVGG
jgi:hypothetical protein